MNPMQGRSQKMSQAHLGLIWRKILFGGCSDKRKIRRSLRFSLIACIVTGITGIAHKGGCRKSEFTTLQRIAFQQVVAP